MRTFFRPRYVWLVAAVGLAFAAAIPWARGQGDDLDPVKLAREAGMQELTVAFPSPVDVYLADNPVAGGKPDLAGVRIAKTIKVSGRTYWRVETAKDYWLVDPEAVVAVRVPGK